DRRRPLAGARVRGPATRGRLPAPRRGRQLRRLRRAPGRLPRLERDRNRRALPPVEPGAAGRGLRPGHRRRRRPRARRAGGRGARPARARRRGAADPGGPRARRPARGGAMKVSNADRVVFPDVGRTKGDVVAYYERIAPRALPHLVGRPLSIKRYPKGISEPGFFQKNVPAHYPASMERFEVPRSKAATKKHAPDAKEVTTYPVVRRAEELAYLANQGAIELHVPSARVPDLWRPDRVIVDLDPPAGA